MFIEYFSFPFFTRALTVGLIISVLLSWMSTYVVLRREVLFTHALSNIGFLGIAIAILLQLPITGTLIATCIAGAILITIIQRKKLFANDSLLGIFSQLGLAGAIMVIALFPGYRINIEQFLFGDILGLSQFDVTLSIILFVVVGGILALFHRRFLMISLSDDLSHTLVRHKNYWHGLFIVVLATLIAMAMKIVGVLLVAAFTTIPANVAKLYARSMTQTFIGSILVGISGVLGGMYLSIVYDMPSGAAIVAVMGLLWVAALGIRKCVV